MFLEQNRIKQMPFSFPDYKHDPASDSKREKPSPSREAKRSEFTALHMRWSSVGALPTSASALLRSLGASGADPGPWSRPMIVVSWVTNPDSPLPLVALTATTCRWFHLQERAGGTLKQGILRTPSIWVLGVRVPGGVGVLVWEAWAGLCCGSSAMGAQWRAAAGWRHRHSLGHRAPIQDRTQGGPRQVYSCECTERSLLLYYID